MDTSSLYGLQYQWCSDSDLSSTSCSETLSPVPSMDSSLSPSFQQLPQSTPKTAKTGYSPTLRASPCSLSGRKPGRTGRTGRTGRAPRLRSKQRESASEKEKLRMRDLTKALHHLRSYLPPSVAPAGQTLTKIETLRLTIRYISYLSAQLGLSEEVLFQRRDSSAGEASSPDILRYLQHGAMGGQEAPLQDQNLISHGLMDQSLYPAQCHSQNILMHSGSCSFGVDQYMEAPQGDMEVLQSPAETQPCCQMCGKDWCVPLVPREYWG